MSDLQPKQAHRFAVVKTALWLLAVAALLLFFVLPFLTNYALRSGYQFKSMSYWLDVMQGMQTFAMHAFVYLWITFLGSCFASFLNVVAWRVPRGRSILGSSHCPHCDAKLSMRDNVPIFGWLMNDGRCRSCAAPIAVRYLIVELLLGAVFLLLFLVEVVWGGLNLPLRPEVNLTGVEFLLFTPNWFLILTFVYHATLMCGLFTIAVIASEGKRIPLLVVFFAAIFLVACASTWPHVIQVPWTAGVGLVTDWPPEVFDRTALNTILLGAVAGVVAGLVAWAVDAVGLARLLNRADALPDQANADQADVKPIHGSTGGAIVVSMGLVGLGLGWQSAIWVLLLWSLGKPILRLLSPGRLLRLVSNGCAVAMFATMVHITFWCWQMPVKFWLNE